MGCRSPWIKAIADFGSRIADCKMRPRTPGSQWRRFGQHPFPASARHRAINPQSEIRDPQSLRSALARGGGFGFLRPPRFSLSMSLEVKIPSVGESITSGLLSVWHKNDGDTVAAGDVLLTLETDKVSSEIQAEQGGVLRIKVPAGTDVKIGEVVGVIEEGAAGATKTDAKPAKPALPAATPATEPKPAAPVSTPVSTSA